jgi:prolipoprotein diacylglyceryltransferase
MMLNMGQLLSLPFIALGILLLVYLKKKQEIQQFSDTTTENLNLEKKESKKQ